MGDDREVSRFTAYVTRLELRGTDVDVTAIRRGSRDEFRFTVSGVMPPDLGEACIVTVGATGERE